MMVNFIFEVNLPSEDKAFDNFPGVLLKCNQGDNKIVPAISTFVFCNAVKANKPPKPFPIRKLVNYILQLLLIIELYIYDILENLHYDALSTYTVHHAPEIAHYDMKAFASKLLN